LKYLIDIGLNHEQQHQELLLTDIKYILGHNPLFPRYSENAPAPARSHESNDDYVVVEEGIYEIGYGGDGFFYDNEKGVHKAYINGCRLMSRLTTNEEYIEFIESGGYRDFRYWLSEGWDWVTGGDI